MTEAPAKEKRIKIEYNLNTQRRCISPVVLGDEISLTQNAAYSKFTTTRENMNESLTAPSRQNFIINNLVQVYKTYKELGFNNEEVIATTSKLLENCILNGKTNITTSKTAQGEILIYTKHNGVFNNLLIDEDADISFLRIGNKKEDKMTAFFSHEKK